MSTQQSHPAPVQPMPRADRAPITQPAAVTGHRGASTRRTLVMGSLRESGTIMIVGGLAGFYAAVLTTGAGIMTALSRGGGVVGFFLGIVSSVFIGIALYVAAVVMSGCVATVIAGRLRQIALLRLLGATAADLRMSVCRSCGLTGFIGATVGTVIGVVATDLVRVILVARGTLPYASYSLVEPWSLVAIAPISLVAAAAGYLGSRKVLEVNPATAMTGAAISTTTKTANRIRLAIAAVLMIGGTGLLVLGARIGESGSSAGFFTAFMGSVISATGFMAGAGFVVPALVRGFSQLLGADPAARVAARNAVSDPQRTTRSTLGIIVGVALVTTFASGFDALQMAVSRIPDLSAAEKLREQQVISAVAVVMECMVVISSVIAAVGFVSTMSLTVIQRRREIGLLRSLGFTTRQVRVMITKESVALGATAVIFGILLGVLYGSVGAHSLVGALPPHNFVWAVPWGLIGIVAVCAVLLVAIASLPPARRAVRVTPTEALRIDA